MTNIEASDAIELLPCPFCGGQMVLDNEDIFGHSADAGTCPISYTDFDITEADAWNTRATLSAAQPVDAQEPSEAMIEALQKAWTDFLDANPDDLTSPEDLPDHALVTCDQMLNIVRNAILAIAPRPVDEDKWNPGNEDPFWMLEAEDGEWLKNEHTLSGTRDPVKAMRFPTRNDCDRHPARMTAGSKWWSAKPTEHLWMQFARPALETSGFAQEVPDHCGIVETDPDDFDPAKVRVVAWVEVLWKMRDGLMLLGRTSPMRTALLGEADDLLAKVNPARWASREKDWQAQLAEWRTKGWTDTASRPVDAVDHCGWVETDPDDFDPAKVRGDAVVEASQLAQRFHETYERLAPDFGYKTREASAVPWADVPANNKALMTAVCAEIINAIPKQEGEIK